MLNIAGMLGASIARLKRGPKLRDLARSAQSRSCRDHPRVFFQAALRYLPSFNTFGTTMAQQASRMMVSVRKANMAFGRNELINSDT